MAENYDEAVSSMDWIGSDDDAPNGSSRRETWRGVPMSEIFCGPSPWSIPEPTPISPAYNHAVLFHISQTESSRDRKTPPSPQRGNNRWDKDFVRLPHSPQSLYPVKKPDGTSELHQRWDLIQDALLKPIRNSEDLENAILSYNTKYSKQWKFFALHKLFNEHLEEEEYDFCFGVTLPAMVKLALSLPDIVQSPIPLLRQHRNRSISLSQQQIASLLANAFFCTFPRRNTNKSNSEYSSFPDINFYRLFQSRGDIAIEKLKCIFHYFRRVCINVQCGVLTFTRRTIEPEKCPDWIQNNDTIGRTLIHINSDGKIEDEGAGLLQVDFANKYLGGGVLGYGCVQEEIRFVICPELIISMLFTESLRPTEALLMIGCERYSNYTGYADSFCWSGDHEDSTPLDSSGRRRCAIVAIDALQFNRSANQYKPEFILRELNKAWVGFSVHSNTQPGMHVLPGVATGNWGCGAFGGSPHLKAILQIMACTVARRPIVYFTFGDTEFRDSLSDMYNFIAQNNMTIGQLYKCLCNYHKFSNSNDKLYPFILQYQNDTLIPKKVKKDAPNTDGKANGELCINGSSSKISNNELQLKNNFCSIENTSGYSDVKIDSFVDIEKGKEAGKPKCEESKPSTSFFEEFSKLEEMKSKIILKKDIETENAILYQHINETNVSKSALKKTTNEIVQQSPKRIPKKISDYFVPTKK